jgi:tripeptide aminopeptidase
MIQEKRLVDEFIELVKIGSESRKEGKLCALVEKKLRDIGAEILEDKSGEQVGSDGSNVIAKIKGESGAPAILLCAHLDTVTPGENVKPIIENGVIKTDGSTILGSDDKSGIAVMLEVLRTLKSKNISHPPIDVVFTISEEIGLLGAKSLDYSLLDAKYGYALDSGEVDMLIQGAPSQNHILIKVYGVESHAGASPERGISAIEVASKAIARMELGKLDDETTANMGTIKGGTATNIVTGYVEIQGEARSHSEEKLNAQTDRIVRCLEEEVRASEKIVDDKKLCARVETEVSREYTKFYSPAESPVVQKVMAAGSKIGIKMQMKRGGGGSDANVFNEHGIETVVVGTGMQRVHTKQEFIEIKDLILGAKLLLEIVRT